MSCDEARAGTNLDPHSVVGLFPELGGMGGIQVAGLLAWDAMVARTPWRLHAFHYGTRFDRATAPGGATVTRATSKAGAVIAALRKHWSADLLLVWHVSLLRLVPFFRLRRARLVVLLHGIEAWHRHDWLTRFLLRRVNRFLSVSSHTWSRFVLSHPNLQQAPWCLIHRGTASPLHGHTPPPQGRPAALMLGRIASSEAYKGHEPVIKAWHSVLQRIPEAQLWIAGDGD